MLKSGSEKVKEWEKEISKMEKNVLSTINRYILHKEILTSESSDQISLDEKLIINFGVI